MSGIMAMVLGAKTAIAAAVDEFFNRVTLLLPGDGTNGAQNNTFLDSSSNNFTITRNGNTTQGTFTPFSQTGWSNYFSGSGNYLSVAYNVALAPGSGDFTVEAFVMFNSFSTTSGQDQTVIGNINGSTGAGDWGLFYRASPQRFEFVGSSTGALAGIQRAYYAPASFVVGKWYHLVGVKNGSTLSIYVDGVKGTDATLATVYNSSTATIIGAGAGNTTPTVGYISNARVVKGTAVYSGSTITVPTTPLTAITNTSLLTCQDNRFKDNSTNAFSITVTGTPSVQAFSPFAPTAAYSAATVGGSGYFDGSGDYLSFPTSQSSLLPGAGQFTYEFWFYTTNTATTGYQALVSYGTGTGNLRILLNLANGISFWNGATNRSQGTASLWQRNAWNHVVVQRDSTNVSTYVNGVRDYNAANSDNFNVGTMLLAAEASGSNPLLGYMSGFKLTIGSALYSGTTITVPTEPPSPTGSAACVNFTNAGITDATGKNVLETVGNAQISTTQSKFGGSSMYFDGTGDAVLITGPTPPIGTLGDFTAEAWIYTGSSSDQTVFYLNGGTNLFAGCRVGINTNKIYLLVSTSGSAWAINSGNIGTISSNTWYFVQVTRSGGTFTLYVDGSSVYSSTAVSATTALMSGTLNYIGAANSSGVTNSFNGYIDDPRVSRYVRPSTVPTAAFALQ